MIAIKEQFSPPPRGAGGGGKSGGVVRTAREEPDTVRTVSRAKIVSIIGEGEIEGLVDASGNVVTGTNIGKGVFADRTPLQNSDGSYNFQNVNYAMNNGTGSQSYLPGYDDTQAITAVGVIVTKSTPVTRTITDATIDAALVTIRVPALLFQDKSTGDLRGHQLEFAIELQSNGGGYTELVRQDLGGKWKDPNLFTHRIELTGDAPWDIRVKRIDDDYDEAHISGDLYFDSYTEVTDVKLIRPHLASFGIQIDAEQFPRIPKIAFRVKGIKVKIPVGYDPIARTYTDPWNGSFTTAWTDNPVWIWYDILTNTRYGFGKWVDLSKVDTGELYLISKECDRLVDDGKGGTEPLFTANGVIQTRADAWQVLNDWASIFRGMAYWGHGQYYTSQDRSKNPVFILNNTDVENGRFEYPGTAKRAIHTAASVRWNNPAKFYEPDTVYVPYEDGIREYGENSTEYVAHGSTRQSQTIREGRFRLITEFHEDRLCVCNVGVAHAFALPGQIYEVHDERKSGKPFGGRVSTGTSSSITIDRTVTLESGKSYDLTVVLPDGTHESRDVTNALPGSYTVITVSPAFTSAPTDQAVWIMRETNLQPQTFRVLSVEEIAPNKFKLTGLKYVESKFSAIESGIQVETPPTSDFPDFAQVVPPGAVSVVEVVNAFPFQNRHLLEINWLRSTDQNLRGYWVFWRYENGNWNQLDETSGLVHQIEVTGPGLYEFRVLAVNHNGRTSGPRSATFTITREGTEELLAGLRLSGLEIDGQGNDTIFGGTDVTFVWRTFSRIFPEIGENLTENNYLIDPAASHFEVEIIDPDTGVIVREETEIGITRYVYTYEKNRADGTLGVPRRKFTIRVYVVDRLGQRSPPSELTVENLAPALPTGFTTDSIFEHTIITYNPNTTDIDYRGLIVFRSLSSGFTPGVGNEIFRGDATEIILSQPTNTTYYYRVASFDAFTTTNISDLQFSAEHALTTLGLETADYQDLSIVSAKIKDLAADKITSGEIIGQTITITGGTGEPGQPPPGCLILSGTDGCIISGKNDFNDFNEGLFYGRSNAEGGVGFHIGNANTFFRYATDFGVVEMKGGQIEANLLVAVPFAPVGGVPANYEGGQLDLKGATQPAGHQGADVMLDIRSGAASRDSEDTFRIFRETSSGDVKVWVWANDNGFHVDPLNGLSTNPGYWIGNTQIIKSQGASIASPSADVASLKTAVDAIINRLSVAHGLIST